MKYECMPCRIPALYSADAANKRRDRTDGGREGKRERLLDQAPFYVHTDDQTASRKTSRNDDSLGCASIQFSADSSESKPRRLSNIFLFTFTFFSKFFHHERIFIAFCKSVAVTLVLVFFHHSSPDHPLSWAPSFVKITFTFNDLYFLLDSQSNFAGHRHKFYPLFVTEIYFVYFPLQIAANMFKHMLFPHSRQSVSSSSEDGSEKVSHYGTLSSSDRSSSRSSSALSVAGDTQTVWSLHYIYFCVGKVDLKNLLHINDA